MRIKGIVSGAILLAAAIFTAAFGAGKISEKKSFAEEKPYKGVITVWQIDTFDGGAGSRKNFLLSAARGFEKKNAGVLVMVISHTEESANAACEKGETPDAISFGTGFYPKNAKRITPEKKSAGGMIGSDCYAAAWCRGGYVLIENPSAAGKKTGSGGSATGKGTGGSATGKGTGGSAAGKGTGGSATGKGTGGSATGKDGSESGKKTLPDLSEEEILVSEGEHTAPLVAFALAGGKAKSVQRLSPTEAYLKYTEGKTRYYLTSQRDIVRLTRRGENFNYYPLSSYNDLYQYISLTSVSPEKSVYAERFINHILSEEVQKSLGKICMFSGFFKAEQESEALSGLQKIGIENTVSVFTAKENYDELKKLSLLAVTGKEKDLTKIKNFLS